VVAQWSCVPPPPPPGTLVRKVKRCSDHDTTWQQCRYVYPQARTCLKPSKACTAVAHAMCECECLRGCTLLHSCILPHPGGCKRVHACLPQILTPASICNPWYAKGCKDVPTLATGCKRVHGLVCPKALYFIDV
jgi:hypothetical protein